jgi:2-alkenal reductase
MRNRIPFIVISALLLAGTACSQLLPAEEAPTQVVQVAQPSPLLAATAVPVEDPAPSRIQFFQDVNLAELYTQVNPGVVSIRTFMDIGTPIHSGIETGQGSGFVIDTDGHIVTNQHVVEGALEVEVDLPNGQRAWATVLGTDPDSDLAVLKVDVPAENLVPLPFGDSEQVRVGDFVIAIGNPFGLSGTMTVGVVSAIGRTLSSERLAPGGGSFSAGDIIQTDAAINPGNSGGPLLNLAGEVIGVNRAIRTEAFSTTGTAVNSGVGFAIPINVVRMVIPSLIENGSYAYTYLGISSLNEDVLNLNTLEQLQLPPDAAGAYVTCAQPGGPADKGGIIGAVACDDGNLLTPGGDLIIAIDERTVRSFNDLISYLVNKTVVGQEVTITVLRDGAEVDLQVTLEARP